uniref:G-protein coupled receptors family 2 profile 2 domain-containing protein n=1 Tax=Branchiostoma floridae TaxID=7739 RepID=C3Y3E9_BRAFL|eukprot:XP_002609206.1 hypothetical protein BRAFLDRAFT_125960 [Branchiostoma floridae]
MASGSFESPRVRKDMEDRFSCPICLSPQLRMVSGLCQHRVCASCLYEDDSGTLSLTCCPVCQEEGCFPKTRPIIPEDSVLAQRRLGVVSCPNDGCQEEMWEWELRNHQRVCAYVVIIVLDSPSPPPAPARPRVTVQAPERPRRIIISLVCRYNTGDDRQGVLNRARHAITKMAALPYRPSASGGGSNGIGMGNMAVGAVRMENFMAELPRSIFTWDGRNRTLSHDPSAAVVISDMPLFRNALSRHIQVNTDDELLDLRDAMLRAPLWMTCTIRSQKSAISRLSSTGSDDYAAAEEESRIKGSFIMLVNTHHAAVRTQLLEAFAHAIGRASVGRRYTLRLTADQEGALWYITLVGSSISLLSLATTIFLLLFFGCWKTERSFLLMNLVLALMAAQVTFLAGINATSNQTTCRAVAILIHYFFLASFFWMMAHGIQLFFKVKSVFSATRDRRVEFFLFGWINPGAIVIVTSGVKPDGYEMQKYCWLSTDNGMVYAFIGPVLFIIVVNFFILFFVIKTFMSIKANCKKSDIQKTKAGIRACAVLMPLLGVTWLVGVIAVDQTTVPFQYIFAAVNSAQGLFIFIFHGLQNEDVKESVRRYRSRAKVSSLRTDSSHSVLNAKLIGKNNQTGLTTVPSPKSQHVGTTPATPNVECRGHSRKYKTFDGDGNPVCVPCSSCSPGYGVLRPCTEYQDTVCEPCEPGKTFSGTDSPWRRCESCVQCAAHEVRRRECTPARNGRCGSCETGWFHNEITGDCDVCSWCYPEYPAITDFVSECNVTGVATGFQCAPIIDAPYPPPQEHMHLTTEGTGHPTERLEYHHLVEYVGEEDHSHGANKELDLTTHCTSTDTPPVSKDITTERLRGPVPMRTPQVSPAPRIEVSNGLLADIQCRGHGRKYKTVDSDGKLVCENCSKCPPGYGVSVECTEYADTRDAERYDRENVLLQEQETPEDLALVEPLSSSENNEFLSAELAIVV